MDKLVTEPILKFIVSSISGRINNIQNSKYIEITHSELLNLKSNNNLIPGALYRITDYETVTTQPNTGYVGKKFDVVVRAAGYGELDENAKVVRRKSAQEDFPTESKLDSWTIKYCIENDTNRFYWANNSYTSNRIFTDDGQWFIYTKEFNIEGTTYYAWYNKTFSDNFVEEESYDKQYTKAYLASTNRYFTDDDFGETLDVILEFLEGGEEPVGASLYEEEYSILTDIGKETVGKGVIYYMKDEFGNEAPYDFKNITFKRYLVHGQKDLHDYDPEGENLGDYYYCYTFSLWDEADGGEIYDASTEGNVWYDTESAGDLPWCTENKIEPYFEYISGAKKSYILNDIVFLNYFEDPQEDIFKCDNNIIKSVCSGITFNSNCENNVIFQGCRNLNFGYGCFGNTIFQNCSSITFLDWCFYNTIYQKCNHIELADYNKFIIVNQGCSSIQIYNSHSQFITVDSSNTGIILKCPSTSNSHMLQNIIIAKGVHNDSINRKTITHNSVDDQFVTIYQNSNSQVVNV